MEIYTPNQKEHPSPVLDPMGQMLLEVDDVLRKHGLALSQSWSLQYTGRRQMQLNLHEVQPEERRP